MEHAEPDPAARLLTVVDAVAARADEARARLDDIAATLDELVTDAPRAPLRSAQDPADPVRLAAIELAVAGVDRTETAAQLRERFPQAELGAALDDVFG